MELLEGLLTRRSVRQFAADKKVSKKDIEEILKAASYAPSAHNKQPWEFVVIEDPEKRAGFRSVQPWTSFAKNASCVIVVCGNTDETFHREKENEQSLEVWRRKTFYLPVMPKVWALVFAVRRRCRW